FEVVRNGGVFTAFGIPSQPIKIDLAREIILKGIQVIAIHGRKMFDTWKKMGELLGSGRLDVSPVITHRFAFKNFAKGFDLLTQKTIEAGKVILHPQQVPDTC
ncbi:MAG: L-threonine 3-dehydrogenase, partial [Deltaproteobacteria bacterium]|nr:L-threonine 3-dehydrogenase [Deltaproteobacteria bacterium]